MGINVSATPPRALAEQCLSEVKQGVSKPAECYSAPLAIHVLRQIHVPMLPGA